MVQDNLTSGVIKTNFLFLIDFSKASFNALENLIKLAKKVKGSIELFYIHAPLDHNVYASPVSIIRDIEKENEFIKRKLKSIVEMIEVEEVAVGFTDFFGNVAIEIELKRKLSRDNQIVVIGKTDNKVIQSASKFLINQYKGGVIILGMDNEFSGGDMVVVEQKPSKLALYDLQFPFVYCLENQIDMVVLQLNHIANDASKKVNYYPIDEKVKMQYKSMKQSKSMDAIKAFTHDNQVSMFCVSREQLHNTLLKKLLKINNPIIEIVSQTKIPLFIMGKTNQ